MEKTKAKNLIQKVFENRFDEEKFKDFIVNLFKDHFEIDNREQKGQLIKEPYRDFISRYKRILKYQHPKKNERIDVLIVYLNKSVSVERARTRQRNFVRDYLLGKHYSSSLKDAALVAFVSPEKEDWRFSFVKLELKLNQEKKKIYDESTPAKRYSYLVGKNEKSHTAQAQFLPALIDDNLLIDVQYLEKNIFNVEQVTNEFFTNYRDLLINLKLELDKLLKIDEKLREDFNSKGIDSVNFAKKLLGQIVFLYFLQKKGWFGVEKDKNWGTGPKNFMRRLFNKEFINYNNFFNDILEPLFYECLNTDRSASHHYYSRFNCKIPFLNGGLFEPINNYDWVHIEINLPNELFSNNKTTEEGIGDGILDILDRYNFTINEEEPLEKEVALDPELLGKIYEKLNGIRPDNFDEYVEIIRSGKKEEELKFNRENGVYYTPGEIVHFMCQESLIHYLKSELGEKVNEKDLRTFVQESELLIENDKTALKKDPGKKSKYQIKMLESIQKNAEEIDRLLAEIKICDPAVGSGAFPVGMMLEIVRLREIISTYINGKEPETHYNLKRHCIENSLYGVDFDRGAVEICKLRFWLSMIVDEEDFHSIKPLPNLDYKIVCGNSLLSVEKNLFNNEAFVELKKLKKQFFNETNQIEKEKLKESIEKLINKITNGHAEFDFEVYFSEVFQEKGGFDIVIGNPPYKQLQKNEGELSKLYENKNFKTFDKMGDIYVLFYEKGINLLKNFGHLCFITSNKWMRAGYGEKLRDFFLNYNPKLLVDLGPGVFKNAIVDTNILLIQKTINQNKLKAVTINEPKKDEVDFYQVIKNKSVELNNLSKEAWFIGNSAEQKLKEKIERIGKPLKDWDVNIYRGIVTGLNEAFIITTEKRNEILANCKTEEERKRTEAIIKPILRGRDIKRYYYEWAGLWVIGTFPALKLNIEDYPAIKKYFLDNFDIRQLEQSGKKYPELGFDARKKTGNKWFETQDQIAYYPEFEKEKICWGGVITTKEFFKLRMSFVESGVYLNAPANMMVTKNTKYILGYCNSFLNNWYYNNFIGTVLHKDGIRFYLEDILKIPIPPITPSNKPIVQQIESLVDKILAAKKENKNANTSNWEQEIDKLVYKLYDLTKEEIKIIEENIN